MDWIEITVPVEGEAAEAVSAFLSRYGSVAVQEIRATPTGGQDLPPRVTVHCYLTREQAEKDRPAIEEGLWHLSKLLPTEPPSFKELADGEWMDAWKEHYPLIRVGRRIVVVPTWKEYSPEPDSVVVAIDPGMAFGTGLHPSTQLSLAALEEFMRPGYQVLDVGTGSGILAIAAAKLGASYVLAVDTDMTAVRAARENVQHNQVADRIEVNLGSVLPPSQPLRIKPMLVDSGQYDIILVNIIAEIIAEMAPALGRLSRPGGVVITAGILAERQHLVTEAFADHAHTAP